MTEETDGLNHQFKFELGKQARDKVSGFTGIITARVNFLTGCDRYCLKPKIMADGRSIESEYVDEGRIVIIDDGLTAEDVKADRGTGADTHPDDPK